MGLLDFIPVVGPALDALSGVASAHAARNAFQSRYQDTVADIRKAGLNPALAYGQGGGNPQTVPLPDVGSSLERGVQTAASAKQAKAQAENLQASAENTKAQTGLLQAQSADLVDQIRLRNSNTAADTALKIKQGDTEKERPAQIRAAVQGAQQDIQWNSTSWETRMDILKNEAKKLGLDITGQEINNELEGLKKPEAQAGANFYSGVGKFSPYVSSALDVLKGITPLGIMGTLLKTFGGSSAKAAANNKLDSHIDWMRGNRENKWK